MGSILDFYLDEASIDAISIRYNEKCDRYSIRSKKNAEDLDRASIYFTKKKLFLEKGDVNIAQGEMPRAEQAICIFISSDQYEPFVNFLEKICKERLRESIEAHDSKKTSDPELEDTLDSLIEIFEFRRFVTRYFSVKGDKKYQKKCYYSIV
ncbi:hypothetical protein [Thiocystis violascens]|uniref:hypothetical protein n=1 Tax=Thiocystis violascens TaxID=73141 RepID=UPI0012F67B33|nr:hypothetical protein [Thiocystis violascens]